MITLFHIAILATSALAGSVNSGGACSTGDNRLQAGTYQFWGDCDSVTFCNSSGLCAPRGCRKDDFPFGYAQDSPSIPPKCAKGEFCPDEMDACQPLLAVGSACQLNRDDECEAPANFADLADTAGRGSNVNGSVCLNNVCMWANATLGTACVVENTPYIAYTSSGEYINIVSRGNCKIGLYCDSQQLVCMQDKAKGDSCDADKECESWNCLSSGVCGDDESLSEKIGSWVYVVVAIAIVGGMVGTLIGLFILHRRSRDQERERRAQYWREQNAFHQNLLQMRESARNSILSLPNGGGSTRSTMYGNNSDESHTPILQHAAKTSSGLRYKTDEMDGSSEEIMMMHQGRF